MPGNIGSGRKHPHRRCHLSIFQAARILGNLKKLTFSQTVFDRPDIRHS